MDHQREDCGKVFDPCHMEWIKKESMQTRALISGEVSGRGSWGEEITIHSACDACKDHEHSDIFFSTVTLYRQTSSSN